MSNLITFTDEQKSVIRSQFFPQSATATEMQYCMQVAKDLGLNPILKEIYFVERKANVNGQWVTKIEPLAGKNAWLKLAHNSGDFDGMDVILEVKDEPIFNNGIWEVKKDLVATCEVFKKSMNQPFKISVSFSEYAQKKKDGTLTKFWLEKPKTMLRKVAVAQALREAFSISGIYDESEIIDEDVKEYIAPKLQEKAAPKRKRRTKAEIEAEMANDIIMKDVKEKATQEAKDKGFNIEDVIEIEDTTEEPQSEYKPLRAYYPTLIQKGLPSGSIAMFIEHFNLTNDNAESLLGNEAELMALVEEFSSIPL